MEKEDKIIKELLEKGLFEKAPEGFTQRVMHAVEQLEPAQKQSWLPGVGGYLLIMFGAIAVAFGILAYFDNTFIAEYYQYFVSGMQNTLQDFSSITKSMLSIKIQMPYIGLLSGIFIVIIALLGIERFVFSRKNLVNLFV